MKQLSIAKLKKTEPISSEGTASSCSGENTAIIFHEWSDHDVNSEKWEPEKDRETIEEKLFCDPQGVQLPPSVVVKQWKRPSDVFLDTEIVLYRESSAYPDLKQGSKHLLQSSFVRQFISSIETLCYLGDTELFDLEHTSSQFIPTMEPPWRPWHHIYSKCKAGKSGVHTPSINKLGKYIVRVYWMGCWRKIYIDDSVPVSNNDVLLPCTEILQQPSNSHVNKLNKSKRQRKNLDKKSDYELQCSYVELWPLILSKALLKVACLTWNQVSEIVDFDIIQCLTGWVPYKIYKNRLNNFEFWNECVKNTSQYSYLNEDNTTKIPLKASHKEKLFTKKESRVITGKLNNYIMAQFTNSESNLEWTHAFLIVQTRNIPICKPTEPDDYPAWKRVRWLNWAAKKGLIAPMKSDDPIKSLKVVDTFNNVYQHLRTNEEKTIFENKTDGPKAHQPNLSGPAFWIDYDILSDYLQFLILYFRPSCFGYKTSIASFQYGIGNFYDLGFPNTI